MTDSLWLRRFTILTAFGVVLVLAATLTVRLVRATDEVDSKLAELERVTVPAEENAADWLAAGAAAVVWSEGDLAAIGEASNSPAADWSKELEHSVRQALDRQRGALETLHRAGSMEASSYGIDYTEGLRAEMPDLLSLLKACRLLLAEARVAAADGDELRTITALATMGAMASSLERESAILTALVGIACERMMLRAAAEALTCHQPWSADTRFLDGLEGTLSTEDLAAMMHRVFDAWALVETKALGDGTGESKAWTEAGVTVAEINEVAGILHELVAVPYGSASDRFIEPPPGASSGANLVLVNLRDAIAREQAALAQRQLVRSAIELRRIGLADGSYPVDRSVVAELTGPDPFTGRRLLYEVREDGSAEVALDGADELLAQVVVKSGAHIPPIALPPPRS